MAGDARPPDEEREEGIPMSATREGPACRKAPRQLGGRRGAGYRDLYTDTHSTTTPAGRTLAREAAETIGLTAAAYAFMWIACYLCGVLA